MREVTLIEKKDGDRVVSLRNDTQGYTLYTSIHVNARQCTAMLPQVSG